jgi:phage host-nuclease inhibitor protein Gam
MTDDEIDAMAEENARLIARLGDLEREVEQLTRVTDIDRSIARQLARSMGENARLKIRIAELEKALAARDCI